MFGLPADFDGAFLVNRSLLQVCIGLHEVILRFDEDIDIAIESRFKVATAGGDHLFDSPLRGGAASLVFVGEKVSSATGAANGTLTLEFASGVLEVYDSSQHHESYQVRGNGRLYIV